MLRLHMKLLGTFHVELEGDPVTGFDSDKVRALLAYLAVETELPHRREKLAGLLWPDYPERSARTSLRRALANLRDAIGDREANPPFLNITRPSIQFNAASDHELDVDAFTHLASGDLEAAERAIEIYQGDFLEGFSIPDSAAFEQWVVVTRESLRRQAMRTLHRLSRHYEDQRAHETALRYAQRAVSMDPYDEDAHRSVMRILADSGQRSQAIANYETFKALLEDELGTEPSEETQGLAKQIDQGVYETTAPKVGMLRGYELRVLLGEGHFGAVYRAYQPSVGRDVAIKAILPQYANDPEFIRRFEIEAQVVAQLEHPHIVPLYDYWREPGGAYLVMRWLKGGSLERALQRGPWSGEAAVPLVDQVASALSTAHQNGVVHRDVKPANILLDETNNAYLSDFGIATLTGAGDIQPELEPTRDPISQGSLGYLSPEVARGERSTAQADIYSLGVVLYELLMGEHPFPGLQGEALVLAHRNDPFPSVLDRHPDLPPAVDRVIATATAKEPSERYPDAPSLASAFRRSMTGEQVEPLTQVGLEINNPYKGLRAFQEADASNFFGRERMLERLITRLGGGSKPMTAQRGDLQGSRFLAVVGPSGSGKSSLVKAGLVPALRRNAAPGSKDWFITEMVPGAHPFEELEAALLRVAINPPEHLLGQLRGDQRGLLQAVKRCLPADGATELLLIIDQFEEIFTLADPEETRAFLEALTTGVGDPTGRTRVLITLRADFYDRPLSIPDFSELLREHTEVLTPMTADELARVIEEPAKRAGATFDDGLVARIVADVHEGAGTLPLLQYALTELFDRRENAHLTRAIYEEIGGVFGALGRRAEGIFQQLDGEEQEAARQVFLRLVTLGEGVEFTRRRVMRSELEALYVEPPSPRQGYETAFDQLSVEKLNQVIEQFGKYRLLTFDRDRETRAPTVEVAHEALLREWRTLRSWLDESRAGIRMQQVLANLASDWQNSDQDPSFLLRGARLDQFEAWSQETDLALSMPERSYLESSLEERRHRQAEETARQERERLLEQRSIRRLRIIVGVLIAASVVGILLTLAVFNQSRVARQNEALANQNAATATVAQGAAEFQAATAEAERGRAEEQADSRATQQAIAEAEANARATQQAIAEFNEAQARSQALAASSRLALNAGESDLAIALALEAVNVDDPPLQAELAMADSAYSPGTRHVLTGHLANNVYNLSPSLDGRRALSGAIDRSVILWDLESGAPLQRYGGYRGSVISVDYPPEGNTAILGILDGSVRLLDLETGDEVGRFLHRPPFVPAVLSPDGSRALWADEAGNPVLLDLEEGDLIRTFGPAPDPEGDFSHAVSTLTFHPDGTHALSGHVDGGITLWDLEAGSRIRGFGEELAAIEELAITPDGSQALSANANGEVVLWDVDTGQVRWRYQPDTIEDKVYRLAVLPNSASALFGTMEGGLIVWDMDSGGEIARLGGGGSSQGHAGWVSALAVSPDGQLAVSGGTHGRLILWDLEVGQEIHRFDEAGSASRRSPVLSIDLSEDGSQVIAGHENGALKLWDLQTGELVQISTGNAWNVESVAFTPDGPSALAATIDGGLNRWDISAGAFERLFEGPVARLVEVALSQDGRLALSIATDILLVTSPDAVGEPEDMLLWDLETGQLLQRLGGAHEAAVVDAALSPDGRLALSGDRQGGLALWDLETGQPLYTIPADGHYVLDIAFSADGMRALTSSDNDEDGFILWDVLTGEPLGNFPVFLNAESLAFSPDGRMVYAGLTSGEIRVWDTGTGQEVDLLAGHSRLVWDLEVTADGGTAISAAGDGIIRVWNLNPGPQIGSLVSSEYQFAVAISPGGERALTSAGGDLQEWDLENARLIRKMGGGHEQPVFDIAISPGGRQAVTSAGNPLADDGGSLILWDLETGSVIHRLDWEDQIYLVDITPDGHYAVVSAVVTDQYPGLFLWDLVTGEVIDRFHIESVEDISSLALSPDGQQVLTGVFNLVEGEFVRLWDFDSGELLASFAGHETSVIDMAFLPDGEGAVSISWDRSLILWDIDRGRMARRMSGQNINLFSVGVDPSGRYAFTGTEDGSLILWDLESGEAIRNYKAHGSPVVHIAFGPEGDMALSSDFAGTVRMWEVHRSVDELVDWVYENRYVRELTCAERELYQVEPLCEGE